MKTPDELKVALRRQWNDAKRRAARLLGGKGAWPVIISIGRPSPRALSSDLDAVKCHVSVWRQIRVGEVVWEAVHYRATSAPVEVPSQWRIRTPSEWVDACNDAVIRQEFHAMATFVEQTDPAFHPLFIRKRSLWRGKPITEAIQAAKLAMALEPNCATGKPLKMLSLEGIDTKFFERNAHLVTRLLDARFDDEVSRIGLEMFLGAHAESDHWLLVIDLDGSLLPFERQRVRSSELRDTMLPGERLLIIENETCQHHLPAIPRTIAILGAGFDLSWIKGDWLSTKRVAYWGDIDTWGLQFLASARRAIGQLDALMMTSEIFDRFADLAVPEPVIAGLEAPNELNPREQSLYLRLIKDARGRLEQEFISEELSRATILNWANSY